MRHPVRGLTLRTCACMGRYNLGNENNDFVQYIHTVQSGKMLQDGLYSLHSLPIGTTLTAMHGIRRCVLGLFSHFTQHRSLNRLLTQHVLLQSPHTFLRICRWFEQCLPLSSRIPLLDCTYYCIIVDDTLAVKKTHPKRHQEVRQWVDESMSQDWISVLFVWR